MQPYIYIPIILLWIVIFTTFRSQRRAIILRKIIEYPKNKKGKKKSLVLD